MSENHSDFRTIVHCPLSIFHFTRYLFERDRVVGLLDGIDSEALLLEGLHSFECVPEIAPIDTLFGAERGLVNLLIGRAATYTAEHDALDTHGIGGTKDGSYIMLATHIVEHYHQRQFVCLLIVVHTQATQFVHGPFSHRVKGKCTRSTCADSSISRIKSSCSGISRPSSRVASVLMVDSSIDWIVPTVPVSSSSMR